MDPHGGFELRDLESQMATTKQTATWTFTVTATMLTISVSTMAIATTNQENTIVRRWRTSSQRSADLAVQVVARLQEQE
jgi:hypothetical protein